MYNGFYPAICAEFERCEIRRVAPVSEKVSDKVPDKASGTPNNVVRLANKNPMDKSKALDAALSQIDAPSARARS